MSQAHRRRKYSICANCIVDNADESIDAETLLHLYNHIGELGGKLLIWNELRRRGGLCRWRTCRRLNAAPAVEIKRPDDNLLRALLGKSFKIGS